jgi:hypothetical protein
MNGFQLEWSIEGSKELSRVLIGMESSLKDYTEPFTKSANFLKQTFAVDVFNTQGAAIGEKWKRLSPYTVAQINIFRITLEHQCKHHNVCTKTLSLQRTSHSSK